MKAPRFWYGDGTTGPAALLTPFSLLYRAGYELRRAVTKPHRAPVPVLCVGNLTAGGSGKTPAALALMEILKRNGARNPFFLTRGYGGTLRGPVRVAAHTVSETGDEAQLLAQSAPVIVASDRAAGAEWAAREGADIIVMDDGFQNPGLQKNISIVVVDGIAGFGNRRLIPAGPLREPLAAGLARADSFIIVGPDAYGVRGLLPPDKPVFTAHLRIPDDWDHEPGAQYVAFCGIGRPDKFHRTLQEKGLRLAGWHEFPDHHAYTDSDLEKLKRAAAEKGARLITTAKDAVRVANRIPLAVLPVRLIWDDEGSVTAFLRRITN